jgi:archaellum component FlaG (FlaF/FlaG flagellin family)
MKRSTAIALASLAVVVAGCSTKNSEVNEPTQSTTPGAAAPSDAQATTTAPTNPVAHVGDTLNLKNEVGQPLAVTLVEIINPATGKIGPPTEGTYVATMLTVKNTGTSALKSYANNNTALVGSNNQIYTADLGGVTECTNFNNGEYQLAADESATGCVVFIVPPDVTPTRVKYTPSSGFADDFGEWQVP